MGNRLYSETSKVVGQTASAGFQIGVRRTLPISPNTAWSFLTSSEGLKLWIGNVKGLTFQAGETFTGSEGISGQLRVVKPKQQLRQSLGKAFDLANPADLQPSGQNNGQLPSRASVSSGHARRNEAAMGSRIKRDAAADRWTQLNIRDLSLATWHENLESLVLAHPSHTASNMTRNAFSFFVVYHVN